MTSGPAVFTSPEADAESHGSPSPANTPTATVTSGKSALRKVGTVGSACSGVGCAPLPRRLASCCGSGYGEWPPCRHAIDDALEQQGKPCRRAAHTGGSTFPRQPERVILASVRMRGDTQAPLRSPFADALPWAAPRRLGAVPSGSSRKDHRAACHRAVRAPNQGGEPPACRFSSGWTAARQSFQAAEPPSGPRCTGASRRGGRDHAVGTAATANSELQGQMCQPRGSLRLRGAVRPPINLRRQHRACGAWTASASNLWPQPD